MNQKKDIRNQFLSNSKLLLGKVLSPTKDKYSLISDNSTNRLGKIDFLNLINHH